uniref:DNA polymerase n=1 Tax=Lenzites betulinus TaxID=5632 RepID=UPI0030011072|nr:DNA polymerase [Lenzites betulinus]
MTLIEEKYDSEGRFHEYVFTNDNLIPVKPALRLIYKRLTHLSSFIESGNKKIIMVHGIIDNKDFSLHHNVLIENDTLFEDYYSEIEDIIQVRYDEFYDIDAIQLFRIRIWNMDNIENQHIKITQVARKPYQAIQKRDYHPSINKHPIKIQKRGIHHITPLKYSSKHIEGFLAMDIETISNDTKSQIPILISLYGCNISKYFIIDNHLDTNKLFIELFRYLKDSFKLNKKTNYFYS